MKIRFLGTSFGAPQKERCQQSILLECGDDIYIFDAGAPVIDRLLAYGYNPNRIKAIFISHLHGDHMNGLHDILNLSEYFKIKSPIYLPEQRGIDFFTDSALLLHAKISPLLSFSLISEGEFYQDENISVSAIPTAHMEKSERPSFAFWAKEGKKSVCITGDLHPTLKDFPKIAADQLITECAHFSPEALFECIADTGYKKAAVIHVMPSEKYDTLRAEKSLSFDLVLPRDGDEYII